MRLPVPLQLCSPHLIDYSVRGGGEAVPATTLSFWAASGTQQRSRSVRLRLRPTHTATLSNATVLPHLIVAMFRSRCRSRSHLVAHHMRACSATRRRPLPLTDAWLCCSSRHLESADGMPTSMSRAPMECYGADDISPFHLVTPNIERARSQSAQRSSSTAKLMRAQPFASEAERAITSRSRRAVGWENIFPRLWICQSLGNLFGGGTHLEDTLILSQLLPMPHHMPSSCSPPEMTVKSSTCAPRRSP